MANLNDKFSALSMKDRAELINIYVKGGMMDLKEIKAHYNSLYEEEPNKYGWGGASKEALGKAFGDASSTVGSVGNIAGSAMTMVSNGMENAEINTTEADNAIEAVKSYKLDNSSLDALANSYNSTPWAATDYDSSDFTKSGWEIAGNTFESTLSGITAGASVGGPWGAVIGGLAGLGSGLIGWGIGESKAEEAERRLEAEAKKANRAIELNAVNTRDSILQQQANNTLRNIAADGGRLNKFGPGGTVETGGNKVQIPTTNIVTKDNYQEKLDEFNQYRQQAVTALDLHDWDTYKEKLNKSDSLGREIAKYTLSENEKYKGSPLNEGRWAGTLEAKEPEDVNFLLRSNIREDGKDVTEWLKSYVNSEGFDRVRKNQESWWKDRHPYQKILFPIFKGIDNNNHLNKYKRDITNYADGALNYVLDGYTEMSFSRPYEGSTFTFKPRIREDKEFPFDFAQMHEFDHLFNDTASSYNTINFEAMKQNTNTEKGHDSYSIEKHSDIIGLKYLLYKEGIYDARGGNDITPEQIGELRKKYPKLRPLLQMDDEKTAWMLNHVAQNTSDKNRLDYINPDNIGAFGGKLNKFGPDSRGRILDGTEEEQTLSGTNIDTSKPLEAREDYLNKQRQSIIDASLERSRTRVKSTIPWILEYENELAWRREKEFQLEKNEQYLDRAIKFNHDKDIVKELQLEIEALNNELSNGYEEKLIPGAACIYTATDNYGKEYRVASNQEMYRNPEKYGFKRINPEKALPGDILQIDLTHAVTFDHLNEDGQVVFNQSKGGREDVEVGRVAASNGFSGFSNAYRFVGRDSDNKKWNNEYNQYRKDYGNKVLEELKQVPQLPTDKVRILNGAETKQTLSGKLKKKKVK